MTVYELQEFTTAQMRLEKKITRLKEGYMGHAIVRCDGQRCGNVERAAGSFRDGPGHRRVMLVISEADD